MLISGTISSLINGVSQQAPATRLPSQGDIQENGYSSVTDGLRKRPPTELITKLSTTSYSNLFTHWINRDATERYVVLIDASENITVFDILTGTPCTVTIAAYDSYLTSSDPVHDFASMTVEDTTIIINRSIVTAQDPYTFSGGATNYALVWVRQGDYDTTYNITLNGDVASYETKKSSQTDADDTVQTDFIGAQLVAALGSPANFTIEQAGSTIWIYTNDGSDFTISVSDTISNTGLALSYKTVQSFDTLPSVAPNGMVLKITGDVTTNADDYWVQFVTTNTSDPFGPGIWSETVEPAILVAFDASTLPHELIRNSDGTFTFQQATYTQRLVGDDTTTPFPSFTGFPIQNVFLFQERLGFLSETNVIMSRADDLFNFFRGTVLNVLDDDPIDVSAASARVLNLRHAIPFNAALVLFADDTQMALTSNGSNGLTPQTVQIIPATAYNSDPYAEPLLVGNMVYFAFPNGTWSGMRELYVVTDTGQNEATNITAAVPHYISGNVLKMTASSIENVMVVQSDADTEGLYVYKWEWNGSQKIQSSWSHWSFATSVLGMEFMDSDLYLLMQACDGVYLERMGLESGRVDPGSTFLTCLDRRISSDQVTITYDINTNTSTITLPYDLCGNPIIGVTPIGGPIQVITPPAPPYLLTFNISMHVGTPLYFGGYLEYGFTMTGGNDPRTGGTWVYSDTVNHNTYILTGEPYNWKFTYSNPNGGVQTWVTDAQYPFGGDARAGGSVVIWGDESMVLATGGTFPNGYFAAGTYAPPYTPETTPPPAWLTVDDNTPGAVTALSPGVTTGAPGPQQASGTIILSWGLIPDAAAYRIRVYPVGGDPIIDTTVAAPTRTLVINLTPGTGGGFGNNEFTWVVNPLSLSTYIGYNDEGLGPVSDNYYFRL